MTNNILISYPNNYWDLKFKDHLKIEGGHDQAIFSLDLLACNGDTSDYRLCLEESAQAIYRSIEKVIKSASKKKYLINLLTSTHSKLLEVDKECRPNI
jgi:hypothetical protein